MAQKQADSNRADFVDFSSLHRFRNSLDKFDVAINELADGCKLYTKPILECIFVYLHLFSHSE